LASAAGGAGAAAAAFAWEPTWYYPSDQAILAVKAFHEATGVEYGWAIVGVTALLRLALFPFMVMAQRTTSRMAHVQPELQLMKSRYEALGTPSRQDQLAFSKQMKALFAKYDVNPFRALLAPLLQLPAFVGMFLGLRKMPTIFPEELSTGGMFWFPDLTVTDPLYILPVATTVTFLAVIETGKDQMMAQNAETGKLMLNVFRVMSIVMLPVCVNFESAMLCYWTANNALTLAQTQLIKHPALRSHFGIWDPPRPVPGQDPPEGLAEAARKLVEKVQGVPSTEKQKIENHNRSVEVKKKARAFQIRRRGITGNKSTTKSPVSR
jgi:YidC/Oxa1 family membrane protein insertase